MKNDINDAAELLFVMSINSKHPIPVLAKAYVALKRIGIKKDLALFYADDLCTRAGNRDIDQYVQEFCDGCEEIYRANSE